MNKLGLNLPSPPPWRTCEEFRASCLAGVLPAYRARNEPFIPPFEIGDIVAGGFVRPADLGQRWRVVGMYFNYFGSGWWVVVARELDVVPNDTYVRDPMSLVKVKPSTS